MLAAFEWYSNNMKVHVSVSQDQAADDIELKGLEFPLNNLVRHWSNFLEHLLHKKPLRSGVSLGGSLGGFWI